MNNLSRLADMAEILGAAVVIGGIFFAVVQMRQLRQQRRELAAIELFRFFGSPRFSQAYGVVLRMPDGMDVEAMRAHSADAENCAMTIATTMENIGVMMYQRIVPSAVVGNLVGNIAVVLWKKPATRVVEMHTDPDNPGAFEWFQWLAERLEEMQGPDRPPAYEAHGKWKPTGLTPDI